MAASRGGQLTKRPAGGMAASRGGQPPNGPQGAKMHHWEDTHQRPTGGNIACNGGARHVKIASLGGHPSKAHGGKNACNGGSKHVKKMYHCEDSH